METCSQEHCEREEYAKGFCNAHWSRDRLGKPMAPPIQTRRKNGTCDKPQCERKHYAFGMCQAHYVRKRSGKESSRKISRERGGTVNKQGYRVLYRKGHPNARRGGYIFAHRFVMSEHLGRALHDDENIHHLNGARADNRIENLELWRKSQPPGARVEDQITWAIETLTRYRPELLKETHGTQRSPSKRHGRILADH